MVPCRGKELFYLYYYQKQVPLAVLGLLAVGADLGLYLRRRRGLNGTRLRRRRRAKLLPLVR